MAALDGSVFLSFYGDAEQRDCVVSDSNNGMVFLGGEEDIPAFATG